MPAPMGAKTGYSCLLLVHDFFLSFLHGRSLWSGAEMTSYLKVVSQDEERLAWQAGGSNSLSRENLLEITRLSEQLSGSVTYSLPFTAYVDMLVRTGDWCL